MQPGSGKGAQLRPVCGSGGPLVSAYPSSWAPWPAPEGLPVLVPCAWGRSQDAPYFGHDSNTPHLANLCWFQSAFCRAFHLLLTTALQGREYYYPQFTDEETEAQEEERVCSGPHRAVAAPGPEQHGFMEGGGRAGRDSGVQ